MQNAKIIGDFPVDKSDQEASLEADLGGIDPVVEKFAKQNGVPMRRGRGGGGFVRRNSPRHGSEGRQQSGGQRNIGGRHGDGEGTEHSRMPKGGIV